MQSVIGQEDDSFPVEMEKKGFYFFTGFLKTTVKTDFEQGLVSPITTL